MSIPQKTLYKLDSLGLLRIWKISQEANTLTIEHGVENLITSSVSYNSEEEAQQAFNTRYNKQLERRGYTTDIPTSSPRMPMLATPYSPHHLPQEIYVQPKLDGMRCISSNEGMLSRQNSEITSCPHIQKVLNNLPDGILLDGELYHKRGFETSAGLARQIKPTAETQELDYHVFDCVILAEPDASFTRRWNKIVELSKLFNKSKIQIVPTLKIKSSEIDQYHFGFVEQNYEGSIIRIPHGKYEFNKRSSYLIKRKDFFDEEYKIVDIISGKGTHENCAIFVCQLQNGMRFTCSLKTNLRQKQMIYRDRKKYYGWTAKVKYQELTDDGFPRQPVAIDWYPAGYKKK